MWFWDVNVKGRKEWTNKRSKRTTGDFSKHVQFNPNCTLSHLLTLFSIMNPARQISLLNFGEWTFLTCCARFERRMYLSTVLVSSILPVKNLFHKLYRFWECPFCSPLSICFPGASALVLEASLGPWDPKEPEPRPQLQPSDGRSWPNNP